VLERVTSYETSNSMCHFQYLFLSNSMCHITGENKTGWCTEEILLIDDCTVCSRVTQFVQRSPVEMSSDEGVTAFSTDSGHLRIWLVGDIGDTTATC